MRSTVRIDDDLMIELKARAHAESLSLTRMLNRTLRAGLSLPAPSVPRAARFRQRTAALGRPAVEFDKTLALAARTEDEEIAPMAKENGDTLGALAHGPPAVGQKPRPPDPVSGELVWTSQAMRARVDIGDSDTVYALLDDDGA